MRRPAALTAIVSSACVLMAVGGVARVEPRVRPLVARSPRVYSRKPRLAAGAILFA